MLFLKPLILSKLGCAPVAWVNSSDRTFTILSEELPPDRSPQKVLKGWSTAQHIPLPLFAVWSDRDSPAPHVQYGLAYNTYNTYTNIADHGRPCSPVTAHGQRFWCSDWILV